MVGYIVGGGGLNIPQLSFSKVGLQKVALNDKKKQIVNVPDYQLGLYQISGLFLYPVSGRISGFICRISVNFFEQKFKIYYLAGYPAINLVSGQTRYPVSGKIISWISGRRISGQISIWYNPTTSLNQSKTLLKEKKNYLQVSQQPYIEGLLTFSSVLDPDPLDVRLFGHLDPKQKQLTRSRESIRISYLFFCKDIYFFVRKKCYKLRGYFPEIFLSISRNQKTGSSSKWIHSTAFQGWRGRNSSIFHTNSIRDPGS